jgi:glycosyltransferase involved in cell wall biosynthesis
MALSSDIVAASGLARLARMSSTLAHADDATFPSVVRSERATQRIVFVNRYFFPDLSATSQILFDLTKRLVEQGIEVHVVCSRQLYDDPGAMLAEHELVHGVQVHRAWTSRFGRGRLVGRGIDYASFYLTGAARLLSVLRRGDIVVAKTDPPLISIVAAAIARIRGARLINWLQDVFPEIASRLDANPLPAWLNESLKRMRDRSLSMADVNVVLGGRMREHLEGRCIPRSKIRVIENWADGDAIVPKKAAASDLRIALGLEHKFVIAYSGNLGRAHEFGTLLQAAEQLRHRKDVVFLMVGGGVKMEALRRIVTQKGLPNFRFLPYQRREVLSDSLAAADVHLACLLPGLEGLIVPSKFYGILAAGRPTVFIGDEDGELARIIKSADCGAVVQAGDATKLVQTLVDIKDRPEWGLSMGQRARELFVRKYTIERGLTQWLQLLDVVNSESQPALSIASR